LQSLEAENKTSRCQLCWSFYESLFSSRRGERKFLSKVLCSLHWCSWLSEVHGVGVDFSKVPFICSPLIYIVMHSYSLFCLMPWGRRITSSVRDKRVVSSAEGMIVALQYKKDVQSLLHRVWLLLCTICQREDVQSLFCQVMGAPFIGFCFFCQMWGARFQCERNGDVGLLALSEYLSIWALVGLGTWGSRYLSFWLLVGHIPWWSYSTQVSQAWVVIEVRGAW